MIHSESQIYQKFTSPQKRKMFGLMRFSDIATILKKLFSTYMQTHLRSKAARRII